MLARWLLIPLIFWSVQSAVALCPEIVVREQIPLTDSNSEYWILSGPEEMISAPVENLDVEFPELAKVRNQVLEWTHPDPYYLLLRQMILYRQHFGLEYQDKFESILLGEVGNIREMRCLEAFLLEFHYQRVGRGRPDTEMGAWILVRDSELRIHWISSAGDSVITPGELEERFKHEMGKSSTHPPLVMHVHNHPFFLSRNPEHDIAGTLIPSGNAQRGDVATYLLRQSSWNLKLAWITNGFDTLELTSKDWSNLR